MFSCREDDLLSSSTSTYINTKSNFNDSKEFFIPHVTSSRLGSLPVIDTTLVLINQMLFELEEEAPFVADLINLVGYPDWYNAKVFSDAVGLSPIGDELTIAVVPFINLSDSTINAYFDFAMSEDSFTVWAIHREFLEAFAEIHNGNGTAAVNQTIEFIHNWDISISDGFNDTTFFNGPSVTRGSQPECPDENYEGYAYDWVEDGEGCTCKRFYCLNGGSSLSEPVLYNAIALCGPQEDDPDCPNGGGGNGGPNINQGDPNWWNIIDDRERWYWYVNNFPTDPPSYIYPGSGEGESGPGDYVVTNRGGKGYIPGEHVLNGKDDFMGELNKLTIMARFLEMLDCIEEAFGISGTAEEIQSLQFLINNGLMFQLDEFLQDQSTLCNPLSDRAKYAYQAITHMIDFGNTDFLTYVELYYDLDSFRTTKELSLSSEFYLETGAFDCHDALDFDACMTGKIEGFITLIAEEYDAMNQAQEDYMNSQSLDFISVSMEHMVHSSASLDSRMAEFYEYIVDYGMDPFCTTAGGGIENYDVILDESTSTASWNSYSPNAAWTIAAPIKSSLLLRYPNETETINGLFPARVLGMSFDETMAQVLDRPKNTSPLGQGCSKIPDVLTKYIWFESDLFLPNEKHTSTWIGEFKMVANTAPDYVFRYENNHEQLEGYIGYLRDTEYLISTSVHGGIYLILPDNVPISIADVVTPCTDENVPIWIGRAISDPSNSTKLKIDNSSLEWANKDDIIMTSNFFGFWRAFMAWAIKVNLTNSKGVYFRNKVGILDMPKHAEIFESDYLNN
jgi:hypothetical protein